MYGIVLWYFGNNLRCVIHQLLSRHEMTFRSAESRFECFAQTAPDLEPISARELKARGRKPRKEIGGVSFRGDLRALYDANLWLRSASRVVVRMGRFHATAFHELERRAKNLSWEEYLPSTGRVVVRVTARKSKLYHSDAIAERVLGAIAKVSSSAVQMPADSCPRC